MSGWFNAFLGTILIRVSIGGTVLTGMKFLWDGSYVIAAFVLIPLALYGVWEMWETMFSRDPILDESF